MSDRKFNDGSYKFGFNGMEKDDELKGNGNSYDFEARMYDPRLGRWLSIDPLSSQHKDQSPFSFAANDPTFFIDPDGEKIGNPKSAFTKQYRKVLKKSTIGKMLWKSMRQDKNVVCHFHEGADFPITPREELGGDHGKY